MAVFIPDIFSGYLNGIRQANQDNWTDATNYNKVLQGQMQNAYSMATFDPAVNMAWNNSAVSDYQRAIDAATADKNLRAYAYNLALGIDPMSAQNSAQALGINRQYNAQQAAINAQNAQEQLAHGVEDAALKRDALRLQLEMAKQNIANSQNASPSSTNPFAIGPGTNNPQAQSFDFSIPESTRLDIPFGNPSPASQRVQSAQQTLDNSNLMFTPSI